MARLRTIAQEDLAAAVARLGIAPGGLVVAAADLGALGMIAGKPKKTDTMDAYLEVVRQAAGPEGTVMMPTFSYACGAAGRPFVLEETPSETGALSEHFRRQPGVKRSLHPIFSYAAQGPLAEAVCGNASRNSFGLNTPLARTLEHDAVGLSLGIHPIRSVSIQHHAEHMVGVPYRYHKVFTTPVSAGGQAVPGEFYAYLRFRDADIVKDSERFLAKIEARDAIRAEHAGDGFVYAFRYRDVYDAAMELLMEDVYGLLAHPPRLPRID